MKPALHAIPLALIALFATTVHAGPRETVGSIADAIENEYFDEQRAKSIADSLREAAGRGEFDNTADSAALADQLTRRLAPLDGHFNVTWSQPDESANAEAATAPVAQPPVADPDNGIRRVEHLPGNIGYIDVRRFADIVDFEDEMDPGKRSIDAALALLANDDALIIDVRGCRGGAPAMVGYLSSAFSEPGRDIYNTFRGRGGRTMSEAPPIAYAHPDTRRPLYVLTSGRTASAAEAFAYTLQQSKRARTVGETSTGAANPGGMATLEDGFGIFIPVATPTNPISKTNWEGRGVVPDLPCPTDAALQCAQRQILADLLAQRPGDPALQWTSAALQADFSPEKADLDVQSGRYEAVSVSREGAHLVLTEKKAPASRLTPLGKDLYAEAQEPTRRLRFERNSNNEVVAVISERADGSTRRYPRS